MCRVGSGPLPSEVGGKLEDEIRERGKTVFLTTHLMEEAERLFDVLKRRVVSAADGVLSTGGADACMSETRCGNSVVTSAPSRQPRH